MQFHDYLLLTKNPHHKNLRHSLLYILTVIGMLASSGAANASINVPQTALPGDCIPKFAVPLPVFGPAGTIPRVDASTNTNLIITMTEVNQQVLPDPKKVPYNTSYYDTLYGQTVACPTLSPSNISQIEGGTRIWAYGVLTQKGKVLAKPLWPNATIEAKRGVPVHVTYINKLTGFNSSAPTGPGYVQGLLSIDQTLHWANPLGTPCKDNPSGPGCTLPFVGSPPTVAHLHGAEDSSNVDGGPDAWFTADGKTGPKFYSDNGQDDMGTGQATYTYSNDQEAGTLWFHDHTLGITRLDVVSGLAGFYLIRDPKGLSTPPGMVTSIPNSNPQEIEMVIQDRQFDMNGQLFFPDGSSYQCNASAPTPVPGDLCLNGGPGNPDVHPFMIPEFLGDVMTVNGAPWPYLKVAPTRYYLHILDGSNARMLKLNFGNAPVYVLGRDDHYLDKPQPPVDDQGQNNIFIAPGERADILVDFTNLKGQSITVTNSAPAPYPNGLVPGVGNDQPGMGQVMQFQVTASLPSGGSSCNPSGSCNVPNNMVRLTDGNGNITPGVKVDVKRELVLKEFEGQTTGAPVHVLLNNTDWNGRMSPSILQDFGQVFDAPSEQPRQGATEEWDIINLTADAHPIHIHLAQFQILNRQPFDIDGTANIPHEPNSHGYLGIVPTRGKGVSTTVAGAWPSAFQINDSNYICGSAYTGEKIDPCTGYGPPYDYLTPNADGALGGNPAIGPYLIGNPIPPAPEEAGWKDTVKAFPGQVLRIVLRWTPTSVPIPPSGSTTGQNLYPHFDPTAGIPAYVWHCHILDHEDNEMMRPYIVVK